MPEQLDIEGTEKLNDTGRFSVEKRPGVSAASAALKPI
jgi:hypothetical protein